MSTETPSSTSHSSSSSSLNEASVLLPSKPLSLGYRASFRKDCQDFAKGVREKLSEVGPCSFVGNTLGGGLPFALSYGMIAARKLAGVDPVLFYLCLTDTASLNGGLAEWVVDQETREFNLWRQAKTVAWNLGWQAVCCMMALAPALPLEIAAEEAGLSYGAYLIFLLRTFMIARSLRRWQDIQADSKKKLNKQLHEAGCGKKVVTYGVTGIAVGAGVFYAFGQTGSMAAAVETTFPKVCDLPSTGQLIILTSTKLLGFIPAAVFTSDFLLKAMWRIFKFSADLLPIAALAAFSGMVAELSSEASQGFLPPHGCISPSFEFESNTDYEAARKWVALVVGAVMNFASGADNILQKTGAISLVLDTGSFVSQMLGKYLLAKPVQALLECCGGRKPPRVEEVESETPGRPTGGQGSINPGGDYQPLHESSSLERMPSPPSTPTRPSLARRVVGAAAGIASNVVTRIRNWWGKPANPETAAPPCDVETHFPPASSTLRMQQLLEDESDTESVLSEGSDSTVTSANTTRRSSVVPVSVCTVIKSPTKYFGDMLLVEAEEVGVVPH